MPSHGKGKEAKKRTTGAKAKAGTARKKTERETALKIAPEIGGLVESFSRKPAAPSAAPDAVETEFKEFLTTVPQCAQALEASDKAAEGLVSLFLLARDGRNGEACAALTLLLQLMEKVEQWIYEVALEPAPSVEGDFRERARVCAGVLLAAHYKRVGQDLDAGRKASKKSHRSRAYKLTHGVQGAPPNEGFVMNMRRPNAYRSVQGRFAKWCHVQLTWLDHDIRRGKKFPRDPAPSTLFGEQANKPNSETYCMRFLGRRFPKWAEQEDWRLEHAPGSPAPTWRNYQHTAKAVFELLWNEAEMIREHIAKHGDGSGLARS